MRVIITILLVFCSNMILSISIESNPVFFKDELCIVTLAESLKTIMIMQETLDHTIEFSSHEQKEILHIIRKHIHAHIAMIMKGFTNLVCSIAQMDRDVYTLINDAEVQNQQNERVLFDEIKRLHDQYEATMNTRMSAVLLFENSIDNTSQNVQKTIDDSVMQMTKFCGEIIKQLHEFYVPIHNVIASNMRVTKKNSLVIQSMRLHMQSTICWVLNECMQKVTDSFSVFITLIQHPLSMLSTTTSDLLNKETSELLLVLARITDNVSAEIEQTNTQIHKMYQQLQATIQEIRALTILQHNFLKEAIVNIQSSLDHQICDSGTEIESVISNIIAISSAHIENSNKMMTIMVHDYSAQIASVYKEILTKSTIRISELNQQITGDTHKNISQSAMICSQRTQLLNDGLEYISKRMQELESEHINQVLCIDADIVRQICSLLSSYELNRFVNDSSNVRFIQSASVLMQELICQKMQKTLCALTEETLSVSNILNDMYVNLSAKIRVSTNATKCQLAQVLYFLCEYSMNIEANIRREAETGISRVTTDITIQNNQILEQLTDFKTQLHNLIDLQIQKHDIHMTQQFEHKCQKLMDAITQEDEGAQENVTRIIELQELILNDIDDFLDFYNDKWPSTWIESLALLAKEFAAILLELGEILAEDVIGG